MNKRALHHYWKIVGQVKPWHLILLILIMVFLSIQTSRQNSQNVVIKLDRVIQADKSGIGVDEALRDLGNYMTNHMNTQISGPVRLENTFYRAYDNALKNSEPTANSDIYKAAQSYCEDPNKVLSQRALCIQDYVLTNSPPGQTATDPNLPKPEDYTYTFITPLWSPDLAGFTLLITGLLIVVLVARISAGILVTRILKQHI